MRNLVTDEKSFSKSRASPSKGGRAPILAQPSSLVKASTGTFSGHAAAKGPNDESMIFLIFFSREIL